MFASFASLNRATAHPAASAGQQDPLGSALGAARATPVPPMRRRPVLVTGMHRSGTTWLGEMLCTSSDFINIGEPLNILYRQTILRRKARHW
jgi:hypothetical protein